MNEKIIAELRAWKKQYDIFPSMAADEKFDEILSRAESEQGEGLREIEEKMDSLAHYLSNNSDGGQYSKGMITAYWAARDIIREYRENHPTPAKDEPLAVLADRKGASCHYERNNGVPQIDISIPEPGPFKSFRDVTYASAEAKARAYLESLPDGERGGK